MNKKELLKKYLDVTGERRLENSEIENISSINGMVFCSEVCGYDQEFHTIDMFDLVVFVYTERLGDPSLLLEKLEE